MQLQGCQECEVTDRYFSDTVLNTLMMEVGFTFETALF
jgi:hypothetical protein